MFLRCIILIQLATVSAFGQPVREGNPSTVPNQPEALVRSLYQQVVVRHPLGIPYGADMKVFAPYLSKALLHRFDLNDACFADWRRQNPDPNLKPPIGLLENGIFSGGNEEAEPRAYHIERMESEKDGSLNVYVRLTGGTPREKPLVWRVAAVVVRENGHFVIDDVIYLKDDNRAADSRLSAYLSAGCDGPRWVGDGDQRNELKQQR
jgi:hypothetical protein